MIKNVLSYLVLLISLLIATTGCASGEASNTNPLSIAHTEPMIILFSDENSIYEEAHFYDALLEIQRIYPNENFPFQFLYSSDKEATEFFNIDTYPTLIVLDPEDNVILRLDGTYLKDEIIFQILKAYDVEIENEE